MSITDMFKPKWKHSDKRVRLEAIEKLEDQHVLIEIAHTDKSGNVRAKAVEKITDQEELAHIAEEDENTSVRKVAVGKITFENILLRVALNSKNVSIRGTAISKITDQNYLAELVQKEQNSNLREMLIAKIHDQKLLAKIARGDSYDEVRWMAIEALNDQKELEYIALHDISPAIMRVAVAQITDMERLLHLSEVHKNGSIRHAIADQIKTISSSHNCAKCGSATLNKKEFLAKCHEYDIGMVWGARPQLTIGVNIAIGFKEIYNLLLQSDPAKANIFNQIYCYYGKIKCDVCGRVWCCRCMDGGVDGSVAVTHDKPLCNCHEG